MYFFMDESGNLGRGAKSDTYFVITLLTTRDEKRLKRYVKEKKREYGISKYKELKGYYRDPQSRRDFLAGLANLDLELHFIYFNKRKIDPFYIKKENLLFNHAAGKLLVPILKRQKNEVVFYIDPRTAHLTSGFRIKDYLEYKVYLEEKRTDLTMDIHLIESRRVYGLQAVDVVSNTVYRYLHRKSKKAYKLIRNKIKTKKRMKL